MRIPRSELISLSSGEFAGVMYDFLKRKGVKLKEEKFYLLRTTNWPINQSLIAPWRHWFDASADEWVIEQPDDRQEAH